MIGLMGISRNITGQKAVQRELESLNSKEKGAAAKIQALEASLAEKSQQKNRTLACLGSWASRLGQEIDQDTRMLEAANVNQASQVTQIQANAEALRKTAQDLVEFSELEMDASQPEPGIFGLEECIRSAVDLMSGEAARKGLRINVQIDPALPSRAVGEYESLNRVLTRLLKNAVRLTDVGQVGLSVDLENYSHAPSSDSFFIHGAVRDGGKDSSGSDLTGLLEPFGASWVDQKASNGLALDLPICSRLVKRGGGSMWVEKNEDTDLGLVVHFTFRYTRPEAQEAHSVK